MTRPRSKTTLKRLISKLPQITSPDGTFTGIDARELHAVLKHRSAYPTWLKTVRQGNTLSLDELHSYRDPLPGKPLRKTCLVTPDAALRLAIGPEDVAAPAEVEVEVTQEEPQASHQDIEQAFQLTEDHLDNPDTPSVDARKLHEALGSGKDFTSWIKQQLDIWPYWEEGRDYMRIQSAEEVFTLKGENPNADPRVGGRPSINYLLSIETAKHIALMSRTKNGHLVRQYFIDAEKSYRKLKHQQQLESHQQQLASHQQQLEDKTQEITDLRGQLEKVPLHTFHIDEEAQKLPGMKVNLENIRKIFVRIRTLAEKYSPYHADDLELFLQWSVLNYVDKQEIEQLRKSDMDLAYSALMTCEFVLNRHDYSPQWNSYGCLDIFRSPFWNTIVARHPMIGEVRREENNIYRRSSKEHFKASDTVAVLSSIDAVSFAITKEDPDKMITIALPMKNLVQMHMHLHHFAEAKIRENESAKKPLNWVIRQMENARTSVSKDYYEFLKFGKIPKRKLYSYWD